MTDLLVVGQGLAGLFAANLALRRGLSVTLIALGRGGLSLSSGCLDLGEASNLADSHPLRLAGADTLLSAVDEFVSIAMEEGLDFEVGPDAGMSLPTAAGGLRKTHLAPASLSRGALGHGTACLIAGFERFRDFDASLVVSGLRRRGVRANNITLPLPEPSARDLYATDIARRFDRAWSAESLADLWRPQLQGAARLGLPAVIGLDRARDVHHSLERALQIPVFEIPTLPPSVPGLRLERALRRHAQRSGARLVEGPLVTGRVDGRSLGSRVLGLSAATPAGPRAFDAGAVILATGGVLHGGLRTSRAGRVVEAVFDLPIDAEQPRAQWLGDRLLSPHPYDRYGIRVNRRMQPVDRDGLPYFENLYACGGVLGGADRYREHSRQGIDLATAYAAVEAIVP